MNAKESSSRHQNAMLSRIAGVLPLGFEFLVMSLAPVLFLAIIEPTSFISGWNEGRSGLLFAAFFIVIEWYDARKELRLKQGRNVAISWMLGALLVVFYYFGVFFLNLNSIVAQAGIRLGLPEMPKMFSWVTMWEHIVFVSYILILFLSAYGRKNLLKMITPVAYLLGMALMFFLDAAFPYASLGPMQAIVLVIVPIVASLLGFSGIKTVWQPESSRLYIFVTKEGVEWFKGAVDFFWPCVGVHSMIIFFMIIAVMVAKIDAPRIRKIYYSFAGAVGTFSVNLLRIYLICYLIATEGVSKAIAFHESAGEILFMCWAVVYLLVVVKVEDVIYSGRARSLTKSSSTGAKMADKPIRLSE